MFAITKGFEALAMELSPDEVITYYNSISGVALVSGECFLAIYVSRDVGNEVLWTFVAEYTRGDVQRAYIALENIEKHRKPYPMDEIRAEYPFRACGFFDLEDAWGDGAIPF